MCKYCKSHSLETLPTRSNCDPLRDLFTCIIANTENSGKEIVVSMKGHAYGLALNYCPICGEKIYGSEKFIDQFNQEEFYAS